MQVQSLRPLLVLYREVHAGTASALIYICLYRAPKSDYASAQTWLWKKKNTFRATKLFRSAYDVDASVPPIAVALFILISYFVNKRSFDLSL